MGRAKKKPQSDKKILLGQHNATSPKQEKTENEDAEISKALELETQRQKSGSEKSQPEKSEFKFDFAPKESKGEKPDFKFDFGKSNFEPIEITDSEGNPVFQLNEADKAKLIKMLGKQMNSLVGKSSGYFESLPKVVQGRIKALKHIQEEQDEIEKEYQRELALLQKKYHEKFTPFYAKRADIVSGKVEPTPEEIGEKIYELPEEEEDKEKAQKEEKEKEKEEVKGIPEFWLQALLHHEEFGELINEQDEEALKYLKDIKWEPHEDSLSSFTLEFYFDENPFFENKVLKKTYILVETPGGETNFDHTDATEIKWKPGKNLTMKKVEKKRGKKGKGKGGKKASQEVVTIEEPCPSFFNFFNPEAQLEMEEIKNSDYPVEEALEAILEGDYELGCELKEKIIPNAVLWFTGEASTEEFDEDEFDEEDYDEEEEDDEEYNSEEDEDYDPSSKQQQEAPECKQQ